MVKRIQVCFNLENRSQEELFKRLHELFGKNMSGGIRSILFAYLNGISSPKQLEVLHDNEDMESVL
jgi:hypothetical protein